LTKANEIEPGFLAHRCNANGNRSRPLLHGDLSIKLHLLAGNRWCEQIHAEYNLAYSRTWPAALNGGTVTSQELRQEIERKPVCALHSCIRKSGEFSRKTFRIQSDQSFSRSDCLV
jgi:hypothetical protein